MKKSQRDVGGAAWAVLGFAALLALFFAAGAREVYGTAGFYAALSRQIADTGVWHPLYHGDVPYALKPPLQLWLAALAIKLLGPTSLAATLWPRFFGLGCVLLTALLGRRLYGTAAGFWAAFILVANSTFLENSTGFRLEAALLFGILLALWASCSAPARWRAPVFYLAVCVAVLSKGIAGVVPLPLAAAHAALTRRLAPPWRRSAWPWVGWSVILALPALWYGDYYLRFGSWVFQEIGGDSLRTEVPDFGARLLAAARLYLGEAFLRYLPFSPLMAWGIVRAAREARGAGEHRDAARLLLLWLLLVLLVLVPKGTYRLRYLTPVLPVLVLLGGRETARLFGDRVPRGLVRGLAALCASAALVLAVVKPLKRSDDGAAGIRILRRLVDARLGDPRRPVPVLVPQGERIGPYGRQESTRDWVYFYLGRTPQEIRPETLPGGEESRGMVYLVEEIWWDRVRRATPLTVIVQTRDMLLVEPAVAGGAPAGASAAGERGGPE